MHSRYKNPQILPLIVLIAASLPCTGRAAPDGELRLEVVDSTTAAKLPVRVELMNNRGRPVRTRGIGVGRLGDHFYLPGSVTLGLRRGGYVFTLDAGAEYRTQRGNFEIERHADDSKTVEMRRFANLADEGWYAGDIDAARAARNLPIMAAAEGLYYVPTLAWHFDGKKWQSSHATVSRMVDADDPHAVGRALGPYAALVDLAGGSLLLVDDQLLDGPPVKIASDTTSLEVIRAAREAGLHVVAATPTAWDLPIWVASGELDAICVLTRQTQWRGVSDKDSNGRPRDKSFYPGKQGLARWGQAIYFRLLDSGLRITPVAGSGSGDNESPLGTNRTYVYQYNAFSVGAWWRGVDDGATVVTNGPLLRPSVGGDPPGTVFRLESGEVIDFEIALNLASRTPVEYLEIVKNGEVDAEVRLSDWASKGGRLPPVSFDASGWFAVRAATNSVDKYQFALSAPYYVESPSGPRISKRSIEFFLTWLDDLQHRVGRSASCTQAEVDTAREFWRDLLGRSNAP